eukprot:35393-Prorocentrum_minimum.AAC.3
MTRTNQAFNVRNWAKPKDVYQTGELAQHSLAVQLHLRHDDGSEGVAGVVPRFLIRLLTCSLSNFKI